MKSIATITILFVLTLNATPLLTQEDKFIIDYLERLENSRKYINLVAETMPEAHFSYKVTDNSMSFAENFLHIGYALDWHSQSLLGGREARVWKTDTEYKVADKSKEEMIAIVNKTFNEAIKVIEQFNPKDFDDTMDYFGLTRSKRQIFLLLSDHITHHRGQMLVSMRLNGLVPPRYVLFQ